jgi:predicted dehydrogenase
MVGFNRRFAPLAGSMADHFQGFNEPLVAHYRVNAGRVPPDHWVHDPSVGGGRIVGEVCHFVDFLGWLVGGRPRRVSAAGPGTPEGRDTMVLTIEYDNGAIGTVSYLASGDRRLGKERVEVHGGGRSAVLEDFRRLDLYRDGRRRTTRALLRQDKGHRAECAAFIAAVRAGGPSPIPLRDLVATTRVTFLARDAVREGRSFEVPF